MTQKNGFILIEFLTAAFLFSLTASGIYASLTQAVRAERRIQDSVRSYDPFRLLFLHLDQDLRNTVELRDYPFQGKEDEIRFPIFRREGELLLIRYFLKNHSLIRSEERIVRGLKKENPREKTLVRSLKFLRFQFPYRDQEENRFFEPFWMDEPYYGIPRAVELKAEKEGVIFNKLVSLPQGKFGFLEAAK